MSYGHFSEVGSGFWGVPPGTPKSGTFSGLVTSQSCPNWPFFGLGSQDLLSSCWIHLSQIFRSNSRALIYSAAKTTVQIGERWACSSSQILLWNMNCEFRVNRENVQYYSFIWKRLFLDTWQHHRVMPLNTQLIAIKMNPKLFLLSQIIHLFQNCVHSKKIVTFQYNFGHYEHFLPKFQILVV